MDTLWVPLKVADVTASVAFYRDRLGLSLLEQWQRPEDAGAVFTIGSARLEVAADASVPIASGFAIELSGRVEVDRLAAPVHPAVFPRGHYGAVITDPDGHHVLLFTEEAR